MEKLIWSIPFHVWMLAFPFSRFFHFPFPYTSLQMAEGIRLWKDSHPLLELSAAALAWPALPTHVYRFSRFCRSDSCSGLGGVLG